MEVKNRRFEEETKEVTDEEIENFFEDSFQPYDVVVDVISLSVRCNPDPEQNLVSVVYKGDTLHIFNTVVRDGQTWGQTKSGWVNLKYVTRKEGSVF